MKVKIIIFLFVFLFLASAAYACFFKSDCPTGFQCVTPKGKLKGSCEPEKKTPNTYLPQEPTAVLPEEVKTDKKCIWNMDCPSGGYCVRTPGFTEGICWEKRKTQEGLHSLKEEVKACRFTSDCTKGQSCRRARGSLEGICEETTYSGDQTQRNPIFDPSPQDVKRCLMDTDCGLNASCIQDGHSVYGTCRAKK